MAQGRVDSAWNHTAAVLALLANVNRDPKKTRPYRPADFHPTAGRRDRAASRPTVAQLADEIMKIAEAKTRSGPGRGRPPRRKG